MSISSLIRKISYSGSVPRFILRIVDELLLLPAMWFPSSLARKLFNRLRGAKIGSGGWIGQGTLLGNHPFLLTVGDNVIISAGVKLLTHDTSFTVVGGKDLAGRIIIGDNIQIGENAVVLPGVAIGDDCVIGAGAVVTKDVPPGSVAAGVPAKIISSTAEALRRVDEKLKEGKLFSTWHQPDRPDIKAGAPPLKICILSNKNHIYSNYLIRNLLERFPSDDFTVIESTLLLAGMAKIKALIKYLKVSGLRYTASQISKNIYFNRIAPLFGIKKYFPYEFFKFNNLRAVKRTPDINGPFLTTWLKTSSQPDLILSLYFNQILKKEILGVPKFGAFNLHPAMLPKYRGISPTFWVLAKGEQKSGITLHKISLKIDEGDIVGQKEIDILPGDSEHALYERCNEAGLNLLVDLIEGFKRGQTPASRPMNLAEGTYFSIPTKQAMRDFINKKRRLWSLTGIYKKYE